MWLENTNAEYYNMMKFWEKLESKSSYHLPNSWWVRGEILLNTCNLKKLWRGQEDQRKPRTLSFHKIISYNSGLQQHIPHLKIETKDIFLRRWGLFAIFCNEERGLDWFFGKISHRYIYCIIYIYSISMRILYDRVHPWPKTKDYDAQKK